MDIVDPHLHSDSATAEKWAALARYAKDNDGPVRRAIAVIENPEGKLRALDLKKPAVAEKVQAAGDGGDILTLFAEDGFAYP